MSPYFNNLSILGAIVIMVVIITIIISIIQELLDRKYKSKILTNIITIPSTAIILVAVAFLIRWLTGDTDVFIVAIIAAVVVMLLIINAVIAID